jgi:hypothetical protein
MEGEKDTHLVKFEQGEVFFDEALEDEISP